MKNYGGKQQYVFFRPQKWLFASLFTIIKHVVNKQKQISKQPKEYTFKSCKLQSGSVQQNIWSKCLKRARVTSNAIHLPGSRIYTTFVCGILSEEEIVNNLLIRQRLIQPLAFDVIEVSPVRWKATKVNVPQDSHKSDCSYFE
jgi:hypothetical protein